MKLSACRRATLLLETRKNQLCFYLPLRNLLVRAEQRLSTDEAHLLSEVHRHLLNGGLYAATPLSVVPGRNRLPLSGPDAYRVSW